MGWLKMYILAMLAAMFVSVVVFGVFVVTIAGRSKEEMLRKDKERYEEWKGIVSNTEFPTQSQIWLQKVKEDNERTDVSVGELIRAPFENRSSSKNIAESEVSDVVDLSELVPAETKAVV